MSEAVAPVADTTTIAGARSVRGVGPVRIWLLVIAAMVYAMILVGGATRLTDSGLSITEWRPLLGAIPPMNAADWNEAFAKYQAMTAQFHAVNPDMGLEGFKAIYWWEWGHRQLGRVIGVVFLVPFLVFWATGRVSRRLLPHLLALFALGGLQGAIGWWMVASGVNTELTSVAPYRLMTHFGLALFIIAYCCWLWLDLGAKRPDAPPRAARGWASALLWLTSIQMLLGALVAGLDAGRGYTDWPLMGGRVVPEAMWAIEPLWRNITENEATTQFLHRGAAYLLLIVGAVAAWKFRAGQRGFLVLAGLLAGQAVLGVVTLVHAAPLTLALVHQALGVVVLLAAVRVMWACQLSAGQAQVRS